jgi:hypothetical protein
MYPYSSKEVFMKTIKRTTKQIAYCPPPDVLALLEKFPNRTKAINDAVRALYSPEHETRARERLKIALRIIEAEES